MAEVNERFFTQAVSNYMTNAIKYCKEEGNVYVRVMSGENNIKVEVENDGKHIESALVLCYNKIRVEKMLLGSFFERGLVYAN